MSRYIKSKHWFNIVFLFLLGSPLALAAVTKQEVGEKTKDAAQTAWQYTKDQKNQVQEDLEQRIRDLKSQISDLKSRSSSAVRADWNKSIDSLEKQQRSLEGKLSRLKKSTGKAWADMRKGVDEAVSKLTEAYEDAKNNF